ncbi:conjugal transfer protein TraH [Agrobacterium genomosp. 3]|jgi:hypothetical protein|uniref:TraH family protein n=1 Tax=Agrobacterium tomkonis TaxID=1183410 RepID=UPI001CD8AE4D|nr:conjugal transfer protein TraH [Agrobacterium tomkonis]MCA1879786.1 conjugal transfer protein TraH [Agrobacterium tumefaciens]MCA1895034.1 conjugal transfer protein TraH [Agrobacterium tomkonis]
MVDAALIKECADPSLKPAIVEKFVATAGSEDPLAITVRAGNRVVLVPRPTTPEAAMDLIRENIGRNVVRVGITQYPAGLGVLEAGALKPDLVDACANLRMGTALFAKVYRIVLKWYGNPPGKQAEAQVFEDAILAWQSGYFEGEAVFRTPIPEQKPANPSADTAADAAPGEDAAETAENPKAVDRSEPAASNQSLDDPNKAGIRVDLSTIGAR